jgi:hypothetical protein
MRYRTRKTWHEHGARTLWRVYGGVWRRYLGAAPLVVIGIHNVRTCVILPRHV